MIGEVFCNYFCLDWYFVAPVSFGVMYCPLWTVLHPLKYEWKHTYLHDIFQWIQRKLVVCIFVPYSNHHFITYKSTNRTPECVTEKCYHDQCKCRNIFHLNSEVWFFFLGEQNITACHFTQSQYMSCCYSVLINTLKWFKYFC